MSTLEFRVHVPSLFLGAAVLLGLGFLYPGPAVQSTANELTTANGDWRNIVRVEEGFPYQVPEGKALVVQSVGFKGDQPFTFAYFVSLDIDGEVELLLDPSSGANHIRPGWVVEAGSRLTVRMQGDELVGYAFGYLVDQ
ncbi:hypothetical protein [Engelhardtia mirabilis]|uniref:Uncharacterized protein n=1 Tax=Engelhardtia mirabilis TaxID=2528011 RepID=A0A518BDA6_9BACT|nr:hypothetical protein Pla133_00200 [Planctomycetes bacterium Pla133]QDU99285.1 hypothetical protein Pla86_00200 [Planctomycetes bacterium Pla86]